MAANALWVSIGAANADGDCAWRIGASGLARAAAEALRERAGEPLVVALASHLLMVLVAELWPVRGREAATSHGASQVLVENLIAAGLADRETSSLTPAAEACLTAAHVEALYEVALAGEPPTRGTRQDYVEYNYDQLVWRRAENWE